jgi:hypothetical protein
MSGLLNRLASQALTTNSARASDRGIRPAASVHAQLLVGPATGSEASAPTLRVYAPVPSEDPNKKLRTRDTARIASFPTGSAATAESAGQQRSIASAPRFDARPEVQMIERASVSAPIPSRAETGDVESRAPRPLLRKSHDAQAQPASIAPLTRPRPHIEPTRNQSAAEPTEVHVHIGRIEVMAMPEPAAASKKPRVQMRSTRPLSEYLARRRRS